MASPATSEDEDSLGLAMFKEPAGYRKELPTGTRQQYYTLVDGTRLDLQLLAHDALWSNYIWNAARVLAQHFERNPALIAHKTILELGAGAAIPSLVCALKGARTVVATDYPDPDVLAALNRNVDAHRGLVPRGMGLHVRGLRWGASVQEVRALLGEPGQGQGFDVLVLGDLLFNHAAHRGMMATVAETLRRAPEARAYVFFTPYRPWLLEKDMAFFGLAGEFGLAVEKMFDTVLEAPMDEFKDDRGDEGLRKTVFGHCLRWADGTEAS